MVSREVPHGTAVLSRPLIPSQNDGDVNARCVMQRPIAGARARRYFS